MTITSRTKGGSLQEQQLLIPPPISSGEEEGGQQPHQAWEEKKSSLCIWLAQPAMETLFYLHTLQGEGAKLKAVK